MPKRPCPFDESFSPQLKVHIGMKAMESGAMKEKMQAVYVEIYVDVELSSKNRLVTLIGARCQQTYDIPSGHAIHRRPDRTLSLLYSGAKNVTNNNAVEKMDTSPTSQVTSGSKERSNLHQMVLTSRGTLARSLPTSQKVMNQPQPPSSCVSCQTVSSILRSPCSYCECKLCDSCARCCYFCGGIFCLKCSLTVYLQEEKTICLSCC